MPHVHCLVPSLIDGEKGWCAPLELGEQSPHYVSFVVPVNDTGDFHERYTCEVVAVGPGGKSIRVLELAFQGKDLFLLQVEGASLWFHVKPPAKPLRRHPYLGELQHDDFRHLLVEIEPEDPAKLDQLLDEHHSFVIGCDAFSHYSGIERLALSTAPLA